MTRTYLAPEEGSCCPVPEDPTKERWEAAKKVLLEVHCDFPWVDPASHWNAVGAILTGIFRRLSPVRCHAGCW